MPILEMDRLRHTTRKWQRSIPDTACVPHLPPLGHEATHLRLEGLVYEDVIAVQLKAVLVTDDHFLHALQALDKDVVHIAEEPLHCLGPVLGRKVLTEALEHPLAALGPQVARSGLGEGEGASINQDPAFWDPPKFPLMRQNYNMLGRGAGKGCLPRARASRVPRTP